MGYGSDFGGGYNEGVGGSDFGGTPGGNYSFTPDYSFSPGTTPGLSVGYDPSPGYGFNSGTGIGLNPGGYDIGGGLGSQAGAYGLGMGTDYGFSPSYGMDFGASSQQGLQAIASPGWAPTLGQSSTTTPFSQPDAPGYWGSKAQKAISLLASLNPITGLIDAGARVFNAQDPAKAAVQALLGRFGGDFGKVANLGYDAITNKDPAGYLGRTAAMTGAGYVGGMLGGQAGSQVAQGLMGEGLQAGARESASIGPYGSGSPMAAGIASAQAGGGQGPQAGGGGGERNWTDTLMSIGSGLYGMKQASDQRKLAQQAISGSSPWAASGGMGMAGGELQKVISGDLANDPGFKLAQLSAARASAGQPGGFAASAAANAAIKYQMERMQALGAPAGVGFSPAAGYQTAMGGVNSANELASKSLGSIGYGTTGDQAGTMPPWLQKYLIDNKMGG